MRASLATLATINPDGSPQTSATWVVNMSFFIDPWLFNCASNPADSPAEQQEQRTIIEATQRALDFARSRGVTLIAAEGNENTNLDHPTVDDTSPDFPPDAAKHRDVDNSCVSEPTEAPGVIGVSSVGPINLTQSPFPRKGVLLQLRA